MRFYPYRKERRKTNGENLKRRKEDFNEVMRRLDELAEAFQDMADDLRRSNALAGLPAIDVGAKGENGGVRGLFGPVRGPE